MYLFSGLKMSILPRRLRATGLALGYKLDQLYLFLLGSLRIYFLARSLPMKVMSSEVGVPNTAIVLLI